MAGNQSVRSFVRQGILSCRRPGRIRLPISVEHFHLTLVKGRVEFVSWSSITLFKQSSPRLDDVVTNYRDLSISPNG